MIEVIVADDNRHYLQGIASIIGDLPGIALTGTASNGEELVRLAEQRLPQVVVTDLQMPVMDGIEATGILSRRYSQLAIVALTVLGHELKIVEVLRAGARGYVQKSCTEEELALAINETSQGHYYYCRSTSFTLAKMIGTMVPGQWLPSPLNWTDNEVRVIKLLCAGYQNKEVAAQLAIRPQTVKKYRTEILRRAGVHSIAGLVIYAYQNGLYKDGSDE